MCFVYNSSDHKKNKKVNDQTLNIPEAATSLIGLFCSLAMKPITEKMANPEKKLVPELIAQTINDCLIK